MEEVTVRAISIAKPIRLYDRFYQQSADYAQQQKQNYLGEATC